MVDRVVLGTKVAAIRDAVERIREVLPAEAAVLTTDRDAREIVALNLLVAIQQAIDLAAHVVSDAGLVVPGTQRELFTRLAEEGVLSSELASRLVAACGMRNVIAHQYGTIDWLRVHEAAASELVDLEAFCEAVVNAS